ncbi:hypothetical protein FKP32DRAFT_550623 [Trametes sanguinea]|nr:hypothetical protein FKP32DRAFT_550623 [Trametes sanguinea]
MTLIPPSFVTIKTVHGVEVVEDRVCLVDALSLELQAIHVSSLSFSPIHPTEFYLLLPPLTSRRMPFLEELEIVVQQPSDPKAPYLTVPAMTLPPSNFLLLQTLRLDGVTLSMSAPFLPSLRHLVLANYPSVEQCMRFIDLMAALESCPNLEELEMRNYGRVFSLAGDDDPQTRVMLNQLKKFTIDEPTFVVMNLLQYLYIPPAADIHVTLDYRPAYRHELVDLHEGLAYIFRVILPERDYVLPILEHVTSVEAEFGLYSYRLVGETPLTNKLTVEILLSPEEGAVLLPWAFMEPIGIAFHNSPVMVASFTGDLSGLTDEEWIAGLSALPQLMKLNVHHTDGSPAPIALPLFYALRMYPWAGERPPPLPPLAADLENLSVQGATYSGELLKTVLESLQRRAAEGTRLHSLWIVMTASESEQQACMDDIARYGSDLTALTTTGSCWLIA